MVFIYTYPLLSGRFSMPFANMNENFKIKNTRQYVANTIIIKRHVHMLECHTL